MDLVQAKEEKILLLLENANEFSCEIEQYKQERNDLNLEMKAAKGLLKEKEAEVEKLLYSIGEMQQMVVSLTSRMEVCFANSKNSQFNIYQSKKKIDDMKKQQTCKENELRSALKNLKQKYNDIECLVNENQSLHSRVSSSKLNASHMVEL